MLRKQISFVNDFLELELELALSNERVEGWKL